MARSYGNRLERSGLPHGTFFRAYCHARLRAYILSHEASPIVKQFVVRHGVSGQKATLHIRTDYPTLSDWITFRGIWAHQDYFHPLISRCQTILDVGTNVCIAAVWLKALFGRTRCARPPECGAHFVRSLVRQRASRRRTRLLHLPRRPSSLGLAVPRAGERRNL